ncbi:MAG: DUF4735 domain-containing protein [Myxococcales bacterium]|nr:DUF4735 domain-containing protein [Myxococcales bacterium]
MSKGAWSFSAWAVAVVAIFVGFAIWSPGRRASKEEGADAIRPERGVPNAEASAETSPGSETRPSASDAGRRLPRPKRGGPALQGLRLPRLPLPSGQRPPSPRALDLVPEAAPLLRSEMEGIANRALDYLWRTRDELGVDVVASLQIYAQARGNPRARRIAALRARGLPDSERRRYAKLLELPKPAFESAPLETRHQRPIPAQAWQERDEDRSRSCPFEAARCALGSECREYLALPSEHGYVLTHQALTLLLSHWAGCELEGIDTRARREALGLAIHAELRGDAVPGDLFFERLAMLASLGYGASIEASWLRRLADAQGPTGCFPANPNQPCHPHPTGLALWTLSHIDPLAEIAPTQGETP